MKIAIIGAGMVGGTLGSRFAEKGHEIHFGVPHPKKSENQELVARIGNNARVGTVAEAPKDAEIVLLAVHAEVIEDALKNCGDLSGKILVDSTNPLAKDGNSLFLTVGFDGSGAEHIAKLAKGAKVVKCFQQTGAENMANPQFENGKAAIFVCGDDADAKETVRRLAEEIGFDAIDAGNLKIACLLEPLANLWIHLALTTELERHFAFSILRR